MPDNIVIASTTDTPEQMLAALGVPEPAPEQAPPATAQPKDAPADGAAAPDGAPAAAPAAPAAPAAKPQSKSALRIAKLVAEREEAEQAAARATSDNKALQDRISSLEARIAALNTADPTTPAPKEEPVTTPDKPAAEAADDRPKEEDYPDFDSYQEALLDFKVKERLRAIGLDPSKKVNDIIREANTATEMQTAAEKAVQAQIQQFNDSVAAAQQAHEDFDLRVRETRVQVSAPMRDAMHASKIGGEIMYFFASNPEEAERIGQMPPGPALVEMGRLEARLEAQSTRRSAPETPAEPPVRVVTNAPTPITPVGAGRVTPKIDPSTMTHQQFKEWRRSQGATR